MTITQRFEELNNWLNNITPEQLSTVRQTAVDLLEIMFKDSGQGISSSDRSHQILRIYENFRDQNEILDITEFCHSFSVFG